MASWNRFLLESLLVGVLACAGCASKSSSTSGSDTTSFKGTVLGQEVASPNISGTTIFLPKNTSGVNETPDDLTVLHLSIGNSPDFEGYCSKNAKKNAIGLSFDAGKKGSAITTGTYPVAGANSKLGPDLVEVHALKFGNTCSPGSASDQADGSSGSVTISDITSSSVTGSYDITLTTGEHVTGDFTTPLCPSPPIGMQPSCS
jgi:hypothetical protein